MLLISFRCWISVEKKSRPEPTVKDVQKPKVRPPCAAPKLDASKYETICSLLFSMKSRLFTRVLHNFSYKSMAGSTQYRFGVLAKIVKHMRTRHLEGDDHPLTIDDILDETNQLDIGSSVKNVCTQMRHIPSFVLIVLMRIQLFFLMHFNNSGYKQRPCKIIQK